MLPRGPRMDPGGHCFYLARRQTGLQHLCVLGQQRWVPGCPPTTEERQTSAEFGSARAHLTESP